MTQIVKIGNISTQIRGVSYSKSDAVSNMQEGYLPVLRANNIQEQGLILEDFVYVPESKISKKQRILAGDVIIAASSGSISLVGKAASAKEDINAGFGAFCKILRPNTELVDPRYFANYFQTQQYRQIISNLAAGANINNLKNEHLDDLEIPLPPLSEQRRIASILDQADDLRQKRQQAIEKLGQLLQATFIDMFGDPVSNPKGWDKLTIEKMLNNEKYSLKRGPFGGALKKEIFVESGYLVYEQYHALNNDFSFQRYFIDEDKYKELKAFGVKPKDIIVSCSGVNLGKLAEVPEGSPAGIINQALLKISLNQSIILNDVFIDIFMHPSFKKAFYGDFRGAAIPNFPPMSVFKEFEFIVPPLEIQKKYQSVKSQVKALQKNHQLADEMNLFSSLQNQAFNGTL